MSNIKQFNYSDKEHGRLRTACGLLNEFTEGLIFTVEDTYFDFGQDWKWTTIIVSNGQSSYQITPREQGDVLYAHDMVSMANACMVIADEARRIYHK